MNGANYQRIDLGQSTQEGAALGALAQVTLCDPEQNGNALTIPLLRSLIGQLQAWQKDDQDIRAVILRSSSDIAFSVGMDFASFQQQGKDSAQTAASLYRTCLDLLYRFAAPVLCLLERPARAGGVGLVMAADLVLVTQEASLALGEALFGLIPANVLPYLRKRLGERRANQLVLCPQPLDAETMFAWGLADFAPASDGRELHKTLRKVLRTLLRCNPQALGAQKALAAQLGDLPLKQQQDLAQQTLVACLEAPAAREGIAAFLAGELGPWSAKAPQNQKINGE